MLRTSQILSLLGLVSVVLGQPGFVFENELIKPEEIFDLKVALNSDVYYKTPNVTKYYCIFRSMWTDEDHPRDYPTLAWWGNPGLFTHTKQYAPFLKNREAPFGVEHLAESGFTDVFRKEIGVAGTLVLDYVEGNRIMVDQDYWDRNYVYLPAIEVDDQCFYMSGIAGINPSPDWFSSFYMMALVDEYNLKFWDRFRLQAYPWDAGTDDGDEYTASDRDTDPPEKVTRITKDNAPPSGVFLNKDKNRVPPVAEWECVLHVCPAEDPTCTKPDWPPRNGCDILKYPECDSECNVTEALELGEPCQQCKPLRFDPPETFYTDCCLAGREPLEGTCEDPSGAMSMLMGVGFALAVAGLGSFLSLLGL